MGGLGLGLGALCASSHASEPPSGQTTVTIVFAASARKTTGLISGPAITARQPEKRAKTSAPIIVVIVCVPTPSGTADRSTAFWPKIISLKTQQKTKIISPQISPEVTEAITAWRVMPRRSRSASRHTSTSAASEEKRGRRGCRKERPACGLDAVAVAGVCGGCRQCRLLRVESIRACFPLGE